MEKHVTLLLLLVLCQFVTPFNLIMMGSRKGKLKRNLGPEAESNPKMSKGALKTLNQGKGQEITGVTVPAEGKVKGWQFGNQKIACANIDGRLYAVQGACPRCAFDLFKGDIITDDAFEDIPRLACPTCSTTYSLRTGKHGPPLKRTGLAGFVAGLTTTATQTDAGENAKCFVITRDDVSGRLFCKDK